MERREPRTAKLQVRLTPQEKAAIDTLGSGYAREVLLADPAVKRALRAIQAGK